MSLGLARRGPFRRDTSGGVDEHADASLPIADAPALLTMCPRIVRTAEPNERHTRVRMSDSQRLSVMTEGGTAERPEHA